MAAISSESIFDVVCRILPADVDIDEFKSAVPKDLWEKDARAATEEALRVCSRLDWGTYLEAYPDVKAAGVDHVEHFLNHGIFEGRRLFSHPVGWAPGPKSGPAISVVVPNFNGATYLRKCIESLLAQTLVNTEFIIVDDASTDDSREIIEAFAAADKRIRPIFFQKNQGTHMARKAGVAAANGGYVMFLDSDDFYTPSACEVALKNITRGYDIVCFGAYIIDNGGRSPAEVEAFSSWLNKSQELVFSGFEIISNYYTKYAGTSIVWNKIYRASICKTAFQQMEDGYFTGADDEYNSLVLMWNARNLLFITDKLYYHVFGRGKASMSGDPKRVEVFLRRNAIIAPMERFCERSGLGKLFLNKKVGLFKFQSENLLPYLDEKSVTRYFNENMKYFDPLFIVTQLMKLYFKERSFIADRFKYYNVNNIRTIKSIAIYYYRLTYGGVQLVLKNLTSALLNQGYRVCVFIGERSAKEVSLDPRIEVYYITPSLRYTVENVEAHLRDLHSLLTDLQIDLFFHMFASDPTLLWSSMLMRLMGIPVIGCLHSELAYEMAHPRVGYMFDDQARVMACLDQLTCLSIPAESALRALGANARYVPNGVKIPRAKSAKISERPNIAFIGRLEDQYKQIKHALRILREARIYCGDINLICIGGFNIPKKEAEFYKFADELGVLGHVQVTGWTDRVNHYLEQCRIMLCTSWSESFNLGILEAQALGLPCVTYDLPIAQIQDNQSIIVVPQGDWRAAAREIVRLIKDPAEYERLSEIAYQKAARFPAQAFEDNILEVIRDFRRLSPMRHATLQDYATITKWATFYAGRTVTEDVI